MKAKIMESSSVIEIPLTKIHYSGDNPRTLTNGPDLEELQKSITQHGVLQPILVRSVNGAYDLIAGARRLAAVKAIGFLSIPAKVIEADDRTAAALRLVENLQRKDLNAIEEAEGFSRLIKDHSYSVEEVAESSAKTLQYVRQRIKLTDLPKVAVHALKAEKITPAIGLLIARIPDQKSREVAAKKIVSGNRQAWEDDRGPLSYKEAQKFINAEFMMELSRAPFKTDDESLAPAAGSCLNCPKRTGNQADLFADVQKDSCTDATCFNAKRKAHFDRVLEEARAKGNKVATDKEAHRIEYSNEYIQLNDGPYQDPKNRNYRTLLGKEAPQPIIVHHASRHQNDPEEVKEYIPRKDAFKILKDKGHKWAVPERSQSGRSPADKAREKKLRIAQKAAQIAIGKIVEAAEKNSAIDLMSIVLSCISRYGSDVCKRTANRRELQVPKTSWGGQDFGAAVRKLAKSADFNQLRGLLVEVVCQYEIPSNYSAAYGTHLKELAKTYKVNLAAIEKQLAKEKPANKAKKAK